MEETFSAFLCDRDMAEREGSFKITQLRWFCEILVLIVYMYVYSHSLIVPLQLFSGAIVIKSV